MRSRTGLAAGMALLTSACATPAHRAAPPVTMPAAFAAPAASGPAGDLATWWRGFNDPILDALIVRALDNNPDVETAVSRLREARQQEIVAGARRLPQVQADLNAGRTHISKHAIAVPPGVGGQGGGGSPFGFSGTTFNQFKLGFDASWELDLFGGARHGIEAARARSGAALWSARDVRVSLSAEVASAYLELRALQARQAIASAELTSQREGLEIARARARSGFTSEIDLDQQSALTDQAAAAVPALQARERVEIHALGVLTGQLPESLIAQLSPGANPPSPPAAPPPGLPSDLLRRRPDLRAAERQVAATSADIGVATADLYPKISLTTGPGLVSTSLSNLLDWSSRNYTLGAGLIWPLVEGGRLKAQIAQADERHVQALAAYRKTVIGALKDVEDALARCDADRARSAALGAAGASAAEARSLAFVQYRAGIVGYVNVLAAERARLAADDQSVQARQAEAQDMVALYKALGGGWSDTERKVIEP